MKGMSQALHFGVLLLPSYQRLEFVDAVEYINSRTQAPLKIGGGYPKKSLSKAPTSPGMTSRQTSKWFTDLSTGPDKYLHRLHEPNHLIVSGGDFTLAEGCAAFRGISLAKMACTIPTLTGTRVQ